MHVLITADTIGGVWTYTRELVSGLLERGHRVTLVSLGRIPTPPQTLWMSGKKLEYFATDFPLEWMQNSQSGIVESVRYLENIICQSNPDVLHFNQFCYGALECGRPKIVVAHSDLMSWWHSVYQIPVPDSMWMRWYTGIVARGLKCADAVVAPSQWMLNAIISNYGEQRRGKVIYNGRDPALFQPSFRESGFVLSVGRLWDEAKQVELLLARRQAIGVKVAGSTQHPENGCFELKRSFPWPENIELCGEQGEAEMRKLYSEAAIYAATSRYEPFGLAPVEAALSGCAIVANDIPVFRELWDDSILYSQPNDPEDLARAISVLAKDPNLRRSYAENAGQRAIDRFNSQTMVRNYEALYRSLTERQAFGKEAAA